MLDPPLSASSAIHADFSIALRDGLYRLGRVMSQVEDLDKLLLTIIRECRRLLDCEAASVALYNKENDDLSFSVATGGDEEGIVRWRIAMGQGIAGLVAQTRESMLSNDPRHDSRWFGQVDNSSGYVTRNLAAVPMIRGGELIGVLEVLNRSGEDGFSDNDLILLQIFGDQAAMALDIHRLIQAKAENERLATFALALADIGHTIKNILMRLEFPVQLIDRAQQRQDWKLLDGAWQPMKRATSDIASLVMDMLTYSKEREPEIEPADVVAIAREILDMARTGAADKGIALQFDCASDQLVWPLDEKSLKAALQNLVGNAIEAIEEHGGSKVVVSIELGKIEGELRIAVADDGPGIPVEIQRRIFDPFFSTKRSKGTGLGLANAKKAVEEHGGRITLDSEPGKGATFSLWFPKRG